MPGATHGTRLVSIHALIILAITADGALHGGRELGDHAVALDPAGFLEPLGLSIHPVRGHQVAHQELLWDLAGLQEDNCSSSFFLLF